MTLVYIVYLYFFTGICIAGWFAFFKISRIDDAAKNTSFWFKVILLPAGILLWPVVLYKLNTLKKQHG